MKIIFTKHKSVISVALFFLANGISSLNAQDSTAQSETYEKVVSTLRGNTKVLIVGNAFADFYYDKKNPVKTNFYSTGFSPIFLCKISDRLFLESEIELNIDGGEVGLDLEYAKFSYRVNKYMTIGAGRMLTPFGAYAERLEPAFIERFPNAPMLIHHEDGTPAIGPNGAEFGMDVRGGFQLKSTKMNYDFYVSNGPMLNDGSEDPAMAGTLEYENLFDNNSNKAIGGRIGFLPFASSALEIGVSGNYGKAGDAGSAYENVAATAYAVDLSYVKAIPAIKCMLNVKGQLNALHVDKVGYVNAADSTGTGIYSFINESHVYYFQVGIHPALLENGFLKNIEVLGRYNSATLPEGALWGGGTTTRLDLGLCYWFSWRTGLRAAYEMQKNPDGTKSDIFLVRFATGF